LCNRKEDIKAACPWGSGPLRSWPGPGTRNNFVPPSNQIQFLSRANFTVQSCWIIV